MALWRWRWGGPVDQALRLGQIAAGSPGQWSPWHREDESEEALLTRLLPWAKMPPARPSRLPRRAGGSLAQSLRLVNRASSLSSSRCHGLHCPGEPAAIWPNLRAWSTGPPHLHLQSAMLPPMALFWGGELLPSLFSLLPPKKRLAFRMAEHLRLPQYLFTCSDAHCSSWTAACHW